MKKVALLVGVEKYDDPLNDLSFTSNDVQALERALRTRCGFSEVLSLTDGSDDKRLPTIDAFNDSIESLSDLLTDDDLFLLLFSGHGVMHEEEAYFLFKETRVSHAGRIISGNVALKSLYSQIGDLPAKHKIFLLDCCRNHYLKSKGVNKKNLMSDAFFSAAKALVDRKPKDVRGKTVVFTACSSGESAYEYSKEKRGVFTHFLVEGIEELSSEPAGYDFRMLAKYTTDKVINWSNNRRKQTPEYIERGYPAPIVLGVATEKSKPLPSPKREVTAITPPVRKPKIILPDYLESVPNAKYVPRSGLNAGSREAQILQRKWVGKGFPLEVKMDKTGILLRLVPPGEFLMGSKNDPEANDAEKPQHRVKIAYPLYVGKFPVTQAQWQVVMDNNPSSFKKSGSDAPVEKVSWDDIREFLFHMEKALDLRMDTSVRLLTEAEWEYACRAGTSESRYGTLGAICWYDGNSDEKTHPVGKKHPNAWGLYDMIGNVYEWCEDNWHRDYRDAPTDGSAWGGGENARVLRGGSWSGMGSLDLLHLRGVIDRALRGGPRYNDGYCRAAFRSEGDPNICAKDSGFRVVVSGFSGAGLSK